MKPTEMEVNIQKRGPGLSVPSPLSQPHWYDVGEIGRAFYETDSMITNSGLWLPFLLRGEGKKPESLDNQARGQRVPILINFLMYQALFS